MTLSDKQRRAWQAVAGLIGVVLVIVWLSGGFTRRVQPGDVKLDALFIPAGVQRVPVMRMTSPFVEWASGTVASATRTVVASRILARIREIKIRAGDTVNRGDILVVFESAEIAARLAQARDAVKAAEANLALAQAEKTRFTSLYEKGVVSRQRYDQVIAALDKATAEVNRLRQGQREAETQLSYTVIRAPVSGRIVDRLAEPGETAIAGRPLLRIYDPTALRVEVPVRETLAVQLGVGDALRIEVPALGQTFDGAIEEIVPFAERGARTLLVKVGLPQSPRLYAGMYARVAVPAGRLSRLVVPAAAIIRIGQLEFVDLQNAEGQRVRRLVTTGETLDSNRIEVLSGLGEGEQVLISPDG